MSKLKVPALAAGRCEQIQVGATTSLAHAQFAHVRELLGMTNDSLQLSGRRLADDLTEPRSGLREFLLVHAASAEDAAEEGSDRDLDNPAPVEDEDIAAHLHLALTAEIVPGDAREDTQHSDRIERAVDWIRSQERDLEVSVLAHRFFELSEYESAVTLPTVEKPFTAVRGLTLVKESDQAATGALAYEVHVREMGDQLFVGVQFRSLFPAGTDAIDRLLERATEITGFAVRRRIPASTS